MKLEGKNALVTGGTRGIGRAIVEALAENGATVVVNYRASEKAARELVDKYAGSTAVKADLSSPEEIESMFSRIQEKVGEIDILVNNAGAVYAKPELEDMPLDVWQKVLNLNLTGAMLCCKYVIPGMKKKGWGRIINVSSISAGSGGGKGGTAYASSKGGISTLTKGLAAELGPHGITVNSVAPGVILTDIHREFSTEDQLEQLRLKAPLQRNGRPEEIAGAVLFLASDSAAFATGSTIHVNGGLRME